MLPDFVFFTEAQHELFKNGLLKSGDSFVIGITNCIKQVMTIKNVSDDGYIVSSNIGEAHHVHFDIETFNSLLNLRKQIKWAFYSIKIS